MVLCVMLQGCIHYSMSGVSTTATNISVDQFFNNTELAPANLGAEFTNKVKDYFIQNSNLSVVAENGQLALEGVITDYRLAPIAPTASGSSARVDQAALTRLTISVKINYTDTVEPKNSFKDRTFSFYQDFDNNQDFQAVQKDLEKKIFEQILIDLFNATIANW
ncbi:MAG: LptE family protein [Bacteroidetes bacterium]|nr:LptE family protein [Bacteroidota bacterium]